MIYNLPEPNYMGTRKALVGVLKKGESLEAWLKRKLDRMERHGLPISDYIPKE
jgi:hypothetical protein